MIHTEATAPCEVEGESWTYRQKVFATPNEVLKGELDSPFELLAQKDFVCVSVHYDAPAEYLVILGRESGHWATVNHNMGAMRIEGDQVEWAYGSEDSIPLTDALAQIRALVGEQPVPEIAETVQKGESVEPQPCGYAVMQMQKNEEVRERWIIAGAAGAGATAVMLGFVFGFRRRRRRRS